ncbi:Serine/threonine-protein phosphatase 5 [Sarracenia purpurea var. burkii]
MPSMETENSNISRAEEIKLLANEAFKVHRYSQAIDLYTQAIELNSQNAVYWANRAFAHTKLEEYGSAIQDASRAVEVDPKYSKGYYRRGAAYLAMGKFKEALKDFQQVKKISPNDPDASKKLKECEKAVMKLKFEEAIAVHDSERRSVAESIDFHSIGPGSSYSHPRVAAAVAVTVVVVAVLLVMVGSKVPALAAAGVTTVLVAIGTWWAYCSGDILSKTRTLDLG